MSHWQCVIWAPDHPIRKSLYLGFCSTCLQTPLILSPGNWTHWNGYCVPTVQCREVCTRQLYNPQWMLTNVHEPTWSLVRWSLLTPKLRSWSPRRTSVCVSGNSQCCLLAANTSNNCDNFQMWTWLGQWGLLSPFFSLWHLSRAREDQGYSGK